MKRLAVVADVGIEDLEHGAFDEAFDGAFDEAFDEAFEGAFEGAFDGAFGEAFEGASDIQVVVVVVHHP